jgi:hypothetical protein
VNISDEAVEAAAEAAHLSKLTGVRWGDIPKWKKTDRLSETRAALEAAAPHIVREAQAEAWSEGAHFGGLYPVVFRNDNPYRSQA